MPPEPPNDPGGRGSDEPPEKEAGGEDREPSRKDKGRLPPNGGGGPGDGGGDDSDSSNSSFGSVKSKGSTQLLRRIAKRDKAKEASEIKLPGLPTANQFRGWKNTAYQNVNSASGRADDKTVAWLRATDDHLKCSDDFRDSQKRFARLDRLLASAVTKIAHGELGRQITQKNEDALKEGRMARGRELLWLVLDYYRTGTTADSMFSLNDLQAVKCQNDKLEQFQNNCQKGLFTVERKWG